MHPEIGQIVKVRSRQYLVEKVNRPVDHADDTLIQLSCLDDDAQGKELRVLWEREVDAQILGQSSWDIVAKRGFDKPHLFSAYLHTLRWNCVTSTDPKLFQAPYRAGIEVMAYQLEPLRKALLMPQVNLFIADDVGLGKTIEAGLILREMLIRQKVRQVVIACPPSVVLQWRDEMEQRFGLQFVVLDRAYVANIRRERGYGTNPWQTHTRFIVSQALLRDEVYAGPLRSWLGTFTPGSLLILDEAHNAAPASASQYAIDSKLTRIVRELAPRFEHRLFLSATPHNGHSNSFAALLEILDPQRFCRGVPIDDSKQLEAVMVRRLKSDLRALDSSFPQRIIQRVEINNLPHDAPELELSRLLQEYRVCREERLRDATTTQRNTAMLVITSLQKRLLSSIEAFARTLQVHSNTMEKLANSAANEQPNKPVSSVEATYPLWLDMPDADDERADLPEDEVQAEDEAQIEAATQATSTSAPLAQELQLLEQMKSIARQHRYKPDGRIHHLVNWLREHLCPGIATPGGSANPQIPWTHKRVLIFTEYTDTKRYLLEQLEKAIAGTNQASKRIETFHGGIGDERREDIKRAFNADPAEHPLRILIATDAAREGVNLQNHCADLFHFDIPWNPSRMEQRNGRIDRKLQRSPVVNCHYFVFAQRIEDRVLEVLIEKTKRIQQELGSLSPVIVQQLERSLSSGISHNQENALKQHIENIENTKHKNASSQVGVSVIHTELESCREVDTKLQKQLQELRDMLKKSKDWLNLDEQHFRDALSASLETLGAPSLSPLPKTDESDESNESVKQPVHWRVPPLDQLPGADPTWSYTLDALRSPRPKNQKPSDWRKESPILPVIFRDPGTLQSDAVHLHLEHRLVQRLLGRFLAQGFLYDDISRACVCMTDDPIPKVVLLGRLSLYGEQAARLHDEVVAVSAEWSSPEERGRRKLKSMSESDKKDVLLLLETSLAQRHLWHAPSTLQQRYLASVAQDVQELLPHLQERAETLRERARKKLQERGKTEASDMIEILEAQRKRIQKTIAQADHPLQRSFAFQKDEILQQRQWEADRRYWPTRLAQIDIELEDKPKLIQAAYEVKVHRLEPVGIIYLSPTSG